MRRRLRPEPALKGAREDSNSLGCTLHFRFFWLSESIALKSCRAPELSDCPLRALQPVDIASARDQVRVNRPSGAIKREAGADRPLMNRQTDQAADEPQTRTAPDSAAGRVRALVKVRIELAMRIETVQRAL